jgi:hypothetical protein
MTGAIATYWALAGKPPGTRDDYAILRCGAIAPDDGADRADRIWAGVPSTPQLGSTPGPGRLPWVTFTPYAADGQDRMAVTVTDSTRDRDAVGRRAVAVRYVEVPYASLDAERLSYLALYQAIPELAELRDHASHVPLLLPVAGASLTQEGALSGTAAFSRAAALAALLLSGNVLVTMSDAEELALPERLLEFDRVLALLPFGIRAATALASWHDIPQPGMVLAGLHDEVKEQAFQLAFGRFAARGQLTAPLGADVPPPAAGAAADYLRELHAVRDDPDFGIERLAEHLAGHRSPLDPRDANGALAILCALRRPQLVADAIVNGGHPTVDRVVMARRYGGHRLPQAARDVLEIYLLTTDMPDAEQEVHDGWTGRSPALIAALSLDELAVGDEDEVYRWFGYAREHDAADSYLAAVAERSTLTGELVTSRQAAEALCLFPAPAPGHLPRLRAAVLAQPELARWLLRLPALRGDEPLGWLGWLAPNAADASDWLRRYAVLDDSARLASPHIAFPPDLAADDGLADEAGEDLTLIALHVLLAEGSLNRLAPHWWPALFRLARRQPASENLIDLARTAGNEESSLPTAVRVDTLRLYLALPPEHLPIVTGVAATRRYLDALWDVWTESLPETDIALLTSRLLASIVANPRYDDVIAVLLHAVGTDQRIPLTEPIAEAVSGWLGKAPRLIDNPRLTPDWWTRIERFRPDIRSSAARLRRAVRDPEADPLDIAVLTGKTAASGLPARELIAITAEYVGRQRADVTRAMLLVVEGTLRLTAATGQAGAVDNDEYLTDLAQLFKVPREGTQVTVRRRER